MGAVLGEHTGVCLCFDGPALIELADRQFTKRQGLSMIHGQVRYAAAGEHRRSPTLIQPAAEQDLRGYIDSMVANDPWDLFFAKDWDWSSETEYRFLLRGDTNDEEFIDIRSALEAVIVGPRFHPVYRPGLYKLCEELGVKVRATASVGPSATA